MASPGFRKDGLQLFFLFHLLYKDEKWRIKQAVNHFRMFQECS